MPITRRSFLKHLAFVIPAGILATSLAKDASGRITWQEKTLDLVNQSPEAVSTGLIHYRDVITIEQNRKWRGSPEYTGRLRIGEGVTIKCE